MIKVAIITKTSGRELESAVNDWLVGHPGISVVDIKYSSY